MNTVIQLLSAIVAIEGYLRFERPFLCKIHYFCFRLLQLFE
jgi:hypothetical protein